MKRFAAICLAALLAFCAAALSSCGEKAQTSSSADIKTSSKTVSFASDKSVGDLSTTIKDIYGSWKVKDAQDSENFAIAYYSFSKGGIAQVNLGTMTSTGKYKDESDKKENIISLEVKHGFSGTFNFSVDKRANPKTLKLTNVYDSKKTFTLEQATAKAKVITSKIKLKNPKNLLGKWKDTSGKLSYEFKKDGSFVRGNDGTTIEGIWTVNKKKILTIKYMKSQVITKNLKFSLNDNVLIVNNAGYSKVGTS